MKLLWVVFAVLVALSAAKKKKKDDDDVDHKVTELATFTIEVKDYNDEGDTLIGDVKIGLFGELAPMTVLNFRSICDGYKNQNQKLQYKNTVCHRLVKDMLVQCGDVTKFDGTGSQSIFGGKFVDESFKVSHASKGIVSMANHGKDTNGSQFFILFGRARYLDGHHVAFGKVVEGADLLEELNEMGPEDKYAAPRHKIKIADCQTEKLAEPYVMPKKVLNADDPSKA